MRVALALLCALVVPAAAHAQDEDADAGEAAGEADAPSADDEPAHPPHVAEANERVARGEALFEQGDYDAALAEFERAYELVGEHPARFMVLYNIARAHERRFRYDLAMQYYRRYLDEGGPDAPDRAAVQGAISTLEGLLATVHVRVNVPEAEVWAQDRRVGTAPGEVLLPAGRHALEVRAEGHQPARVEVQLAPRTEQTLELELEALAEEFRGIEPAFFWTATIAAGAAALAGAGFGTAALVRRGEIDDQLDDPVERIHVGEDDRDGLRRLMLVADVLFGAAVLFGGTAVVFAFLTDWDGPAEEEGVASVRPWLAVGGGGLEVTW